MGFRKLLKLALGGVLVSGVVAANAEVPLHEAWSLAGYVCTTGEQSFGQILAGNFSRIHETIYTVEGAYALAKDNLICRFFYPLFDTIQTAAAITYRHECPHHQKAWEGDLFLVGRFSRFPWNNYLLTTFAFGDGISFASDNLYSDGDSTLPREHCSRFLNYLMLEISLALPRFPNIQFLLRLHHRCTAWGTYSKSASAGSTSVGFGLRYIF